MSGNIIAPNSMVNSDEYIGNQFQIMNGEQKFHINEEAKKLAMIIGSPAPSPERQELLNV
jgi:hypothetical protein